jgi:diadenosine tetraphosphate (Ap4A) HIT family hydrolase
MKQDCPFCSLSDARVVSRGLLTTTIQDAFPVSRGHTLVISNRHVASFFEISDEEQAEVLVAVRKVKLALDADLHPDGFNIGVNVGLAAGQTVMHAHVHVIPRFHGDVADPRGGVRHCIPDRGHYQAKP